MQLASLGWDEAFASSFEPFEREGLVPGRVAAEQGPLLRVLTAEGERLGEVAGRLRFSARSRADLPAVGDWVALRAVGNDERAVIDAVLPRRSRFSRKSAGATTQEQVLAANVDTVFLVMGLDGDYNPRRIERALLLAWESGAAPVIVLNKADVCDESAARAAEIEGLAAGVPVVAISAATGEGMDALAPHVAPRRTVALLGSSSVGKSTIVNRLLGEERQPTRAVRASDDRGRHTTTYRELIVLPGGALLIDTPGMRELQLWGGEQGLAAAFDDIETLAAGCGFRDCSHKREPRCAVRAALNDGRLAEERLASYFKLQAELRSLAIRQDVGLQAAQKQR